MHTLARLVKSDCCWKLYDSGNVFRLDSLFVMPRVYTGDELTAQYNFVFAEASFYSGLQLSTLKICVFYS